MEKKGSLEAAFLFSSVSKSAQIVVCDIVIYINYR